MAKPSSVVLSAVEFDVLWESERLPRRPVALDVPSPGRTRAERADIVAATWDGLRRRGLAGHARAVPEITDALALLAAPSRAVDAWVWTDHRISALAAGSGGQAVLAVVDRSEVWLIPARDSSLAEAAVSVAGQHPAATRGHSVSLPAAVLAAADAEAGGSPAAMITRLTERAVPLSEAQAVAGMLAGMSLRGQFGAQRRARDGRMVRAGRVVGMHDTPDGRYLFLTRPSTDGSDWSTLTPAGNDRIAGCLWELLDEVGGEPAPPGSAPG